MSATAEETDAKLAAAALAQYGFKGDTVRRVALAVAKAFADAPGNSVWADEVKLPELNDDSKNVVGLVWKNLAKWGIVRRCEGATDHRRSRNPSRKGGVAWRYELASHSLLKTFMARNQVEPLATDQMEMFQ